MDSILVVNAGSSSVKFELFAVGVEPAWTLLTVDSLRALRQEPSAGLKIVQLGRIARPSISRLAR